MAFGFDSRSAALARRIKGARHGHATVRAQGRVPGAEARAAYAAMRRERKVAVGDADKVQALSVVRPGASELP